MSQLRIQSIHSSRSGRAPGLNCSNDATSAMVQFSERVAAFYIAALATVLSCAITAWSVWMHVDAGGRHAARRVRLAAAAGGGAAEPATMASHESDTFDTDAEIRRDTIRILILGARCGAC